MKNKINNFIILFFLLLFLILFFNSREYKHLISFFFKRDDEILYKFKILKNNHKIYSIAKKNENFIGFIKQLNPISSNKSFVNKEGRSQVLMFHYYWGLEKGKEIYKIKSKNLFRLPFFTEKFLNKNNINISEKCKQTREKNLFNLNVKINQITKENLFFNNSNLSHALYYFRLKIHTNNRFLSLLTIDKNKRIINRTEIDLRNSNHPTNHSYTNKIINISKNIILLDSGSENNTGVLKKNNDVWLLFYLKNYEPFELISNFYDSQDEFFIYSNLNSSNLNYKIKSINENYKILNKELKIILCK